MTEGPQEPIVDHHPHTLLNSLLYLIFSHTIAQ